MPSSEAILGSLTTIANEWRMLAIVWHMALGASIVALIAGWRPSNRVGAYMLIAPLISVSAVAWAWGNPFNGAMFALLAALLVRIASRISSQPVHMARPLLFVAAAMLMVFGWTYPHFLERNPWTTYLYAAPMGLLPCPTLATVIGATVMLSMLDSTRWTATVAIAGLVYGAIGVLELRVNLDYGLLAGALMALGALAHRAPIGTVRTTSDERFQGRAVGSGKKLARDEENFRAHLKTAPSPPRLARSSRLQ
jgi:hypothetical protein